ncbi:MAG: hypothetical protein UZ17_ACD001002797 [Acidobacteria bacterium OLB17]|nr:MAG: hypothetical protein UZ17_ACD001002797 [Acidobacteria bacterium OLB17]MCZ2391155.1 DUF4287 domain-containing protein [Acidobacteriota bacterium]
MAQKTSGEFEKEFVDGLSNSTGTDLAGWMTMLAGTAITKRNDMIAWLKNEHGFGHMNASLLAGIHANGGKLVYQSTDNLLADQFAKAPDMRPLYEEFVEYITKNFPNATLLPKKTYVSVLEKREFCAVNIKKAELRIGLDLGDRPFDDTVEKAKLTGPMPRISHMVVAADNGRFDGNLTELLK